MAPCFELGDELFGAVGRRDALDGRSTGRSYSTQRRAACAAECTSPRQPPNGRASWPVMAAVRRAGGAPGARPLLPMSRAMASGDEYCTGSNANCPGDAVASNTTV